MLGLGASSILGGIHEIPSDGDNLLIMKRSDVMGVPESTLADQKAA